MHLLLSGYRINGKRINNLFYWFACPQACRYDPESKAVLCIQEEKDEEGWKEKNERGMKMKIIMVFSVLIQFCGWECAYGEIWASFSGQFGCELNWPLPHRKSAVIFREYFTLNPCSSYLGSCSFGLWLPSTQFERFRISLHITTFVILIMLRFLRFKIYSAFCAI